MRPRSRPKTFKPDGVADYLDRDFSGLTGATDMSSLAVAMAADQAAAQTALNAFADAMATAQADLAAQLRLPYPHADAGGPYTADEGAGVALDATATTHPDYPDTSLSYAWDLDLDGQFDDASGQMPVVTINRELDGYLGLQVTAPTGFKDVAYARVTINNVDDAPAIHTASPGPAPVVPFDGSQAFSIGASDPDGDSLTYAWDLDGDLVGAGASYSYSGSLADVGEHIVTVTVSDGSPLSEDTRFFWRMSVAGPDADGDGFPANVDCDDTKAAINPGVAEIPHNGVDDDCDPATPDDPDFDDDGYDFAQDCDDNDAAVHPGAAEVCNGKDDNCDDAIDEGYDSDGDGMTTCAGDCNDTNPTVYTGAPELCDLIDNDCDGLADEGLDGDGDGFTLCAGDCNDTDASVFPGNLEVCDRKDNDCDGATDEGFDADGDGFSACAIPVADCNDTNATVYPGAPELCDSIDNNCNGGTDEGVNADLDGDGFSVCTGDCNDAQSAIKPGAVEQCNRIDDDCDGAADEEFDLDGDGVSTCALPVADCNDGDASIYPGAVEVFHNGRDDDCNPATADDWSATFAIATDDEARVYYVHSNGDGTWSGFKQIAQLSGAIRGAAIADYDNDGDLDVIVGSPSGNTARFYLFLNDGADNLIDMGIVGTGNNANSYQMDMTAGDFDHDGDTDFLGNGNSRYSHLGLGDGAGNFTVATLDLGTGDGRGLDVADFDHDGHLDFVRALSGGAIYLHRGKGDGTFAAPVQFASSSDPYGLVAADFDNDGHPDVIHNSSSSGDATLRRGNGNGTFAAGISVPSIDFGNYGAYDAYDFDGDGNQDLVTVSYSSRVVRYYRGNGDGTFGVAVSVGTTTGNSLGVSAPPGPPPVGDPIAVVDPGFVQRVIGASVDLSGANSYDDGAIVSFAWDFGDSSSDIGVDVTHLFPAAEANYQVRLSVTDDEGKIGIGPALVRLLGNPPIADSGGPYTFGEDQASAGIYRVAFDGSGSSDDGVAPLTYLWEIDDGFLEDFSGGAVDPNVWAASGASVSAGEASVAGAGSWGPRYLVSQGTFARGTMARSFTGRVGTPVNPTVMWGLKNTGSDYSYTQFAYAIYFNSDGGVYVYEDGSNRGSKVAYTEGQAYDVRIDLKPTSGATYYVRPTGSPNWTRIYDSEYSSASLFRFGATVHSGTIKLDDFKVANQTFTQEQPTVVFTDEGLFGIELTVTDGVGQTDRDTTTVALVDGAPPSADPGGPYTPGEAQASCNQWTVAFDGTGSTDDSGIWKYEWAFGDGGTATGPTPSHTYAAPGTYTVTLTATDNGLQPNSATTTVATTPSAPPTANPGGPYPVDETAASGGLWSVVLNGTGSTDDVGLCDYQWNFGDGSTGTGATPTHQYAAAGTYTATLRVRDHAHQDHSATATVTVGVNDPPVADAGGPYAADEGAAVGGKWTVDFDATGSTDDHGIWKYEWDFGDGSTGTGATPTHQYSATGTYNATLTVTDNGRQARSQTTQVMVSGNGVPVADAGPALTTEVGLPVTLDATGSIDDFGLFSYAWDFDLPPFSETFAAGILDTGVWAAAGASVSGGDALVTGAGSWGNRYLVTQDQFARNPGDSYTGRLLVEAGGGNRYVMWGLKSANDDFSYTQFYYAIYFTNGAIHIYEAGSNRGQKGTYTDGTSYDVRIDVKATGAVYSIRATGTANWTLLYDSAYSNATSFRLGATVHSGVIHLDDFSAPSPVSSDKLRALPEPTVTYRQPGTYNPTVRVTDHALQTDTDGTSVTVVVGAAPVANAGGPYLANEDIPTRFSARTSSDDFGIATYTWDFGDGQGLTTRNPWVDHGYTAAGSYTATLTVTDYAGQSAIDSTTVNVSPNPVVAAVPWAFSGGVEVPHDTWSGRQTTLKGVAWSLHEPLTYRWDFGDGSAPVSGTVSDKRAIEAKHVYTGPDGAPFVASLTVTDSQGRTASDNYLIRIREKSIDIEINAAIDEGLWWLHKNQNRATFAAGTYGNAAVDHGYWDNDGGWQGTGFRASPTASAVQSFEINAHLELGDVREDPYVETVARGLRYLPTYVRSIAIGVQNHGDPDSNLNGVGLETIGGDGRPPYEVGQVMDALVASGSRDTYAITGPAGVRDRRYYDLVVDMVDAYAWGQVDGGGARGGWQYSWNSGSDNSAAQWGPIGMLAAQHVWGIGIPQWVKDENNLWLSYSYNGTGFGYNGPGNGRNTTPSGMVQLAFGDKLGVDDPATPADDRDPRWATAEDYIANNWNGGFWFWNSSASSAYSYYSYYAFTKAMRTARPAPIANLRATGLDWFKDNTNGIARRLVNRQQGDGGWPRDGDPGGTYVGYDLTSAWSVIILTPTLFQQPPVADAGEDRVWGVDVPITLDGSRSYHLDPFRAIVRYEWDLDGDGTYDTSSTDPTYTYTYSSADYPAGTLPRTITARLRVTDNNAPVATDTDTVHIILAVPPHPPVADANGPYTCTAGLACRLDGSASFDIDPTDYITAWEWDIDNNGSFGDETGEIAATVFAVPGIYNVGLRVTDNAVLNDRNHNGVQDPEERLDDFDFVTVTVVANAPPTANAGGPYTVDEGSNIGLSGSGGDPNGDPLSYAWDLDNDGDYDDATGQAPTYTGVDDGVYPIGLEVRDGLLAATASTTVTVSNVAPAVNAGADGGIDEGGAFMGSGAFADPGADIWSATVDYGDGSGTQPLPLDADKTFDLSHVYADNGTYSVTVTVTDDDGGVGSDSLVVTVGDLAPTARLAGPASRNEGQAGTYDAGGSTSSPDAIAGYEWDWTYDGGTFTPSGDSGASASHAWADNGPYTVAVRVTDEDGSSDIATLEVTVANLAPVVEAGPDQGTAPGASVSLAPATFTDAGIADTHIASIDWGDGSPVEMGTVSEANGSGSVAGSHGYAAAGTYRVTVTVTDDEGGVGSDGLIVTVESTTPPVQTIFDLSAAIKSGKVGLAWSAVAGAQGYNLYRATVAGGPFALLVAGHVCAAVPCVYLDADVTNGVTYYYAVTSVSGGVESLRSNQVSATPTARRR